MFKEQKIFLLIVLLFKGNVFGSNQNIFAFSHFFHFRLVLFLMQKKKKKKKKKKKNK